MRRTRDRQEGPSDIPALKPYWGKPAVRNFRGSHGNVGIMRSPVRAMALPGGWLPLGPGDSFYPWYGPNGSQLKGVSVTDAINITRLTRVVAPLRDDNE